MLRRRITGFVIAGIVALTLAPAPVADAASDRRGLEVAPASVIHAAKPGSTFVVVLRLTNSTSSSLHIETGGIAARGASNPGSLVAIDAKASKDTTRNASSWLGFPQRAFDLAAQEAANVPVTVHVPDDARPGVHSVLATFSVPTTTASNGGAGVSGKAGLASALLLEVPGDAQSSARIVHTDGPTTTRGGRSTDFTAQVENTGDTLLRLDAEVRLDSPWSAKRTLGTDEQIVLPGGQRRLVMHYTDPPLVGRYTPKLVVVGGAGSDVHITSELATLWVLPPWWLVALLIAAVVLAAFGVRARRRQRRD